MKCKNVTIEKFDILVSYKIISIIAAVNFGQQGAPVMASTCFLHKANGKHSEPCLWISIYFVDSLIIYKSLIMVYKTKK